MNCNRWVRTAATVIGVTLATTAQAQSADSILSRHVREADGSTGQDTNSGYGIKAGHLQNGAVTAAKLASAAVGTAAIADGAVTDAKIAGSISGSKVSRSGLDADMLDGLHAGAFSAANHGHEIDHVWQLHEELAGRPKPARNVIVVSMDGDLRDPAAAAASIADASEANPYLIRVMPGVYDLTAAVVLPEYVHLEGSGRGITVIRGGPSIAAGGAVVSTALRHAEVRDLTIVSDGVQSALQGVGRFTNLEILVGGSCQAGRSAVGIFLFGGEVRDARIVVQPAECLGWSTAISVGNRDAPGPIRISDVDATVVASAAGGLGVDYNTEVQVSNSRFRVTAATEAIGIGPGTVDARNVAVTVTATANPSGARGFSVSGASALANSHIDAGQVGRAVDASARLGALEVSGSKLVGRVINTFGDTVFRCFGNYDAAFAPVTCPSP